MTILINIDVPSLSEAEGFYARAFGLKRGRKIGNSVLEMLGWPTPVYLLQRERGTRAAASQERDYARHWTPVHLDVAVPGIEKAVRKAVGAGATLELMDQASFGKIAIFADPFGHGFCLIEFSSRGYDAVAGD